MTPGASIPALSRRAVLGGAGAAGFAAPGWAQPASEGRGVREAPGGRASPPQAPILMPGTAMHVGPIRAIAMSSDGTVAATGSNDRSIRLWRTATGESLLRLHLPVGDGAVGAIDAVAFSPDNRRLYVAGLDWASPAGSSQGMVYVFDLATGQMNGLMAWPAGFGSRLRTLAVSPSGTQLALAAGNNGLIIRDLQAPAFALRYAETANPVAATSAIAYTPDGSLLAAAASNGRLRIFAMQGAGIAEAAVRTLPGGGQPNSVAFSPDGDRVAVGFVDRPFIQVVPLRAGTPVTLLPPAGSSTGNLAAVAWGAGEGGQSWLYAGGTVVDGAGRNLLLAWRDGRAGAPVALPVSRDSITQLAPHPQGGVAFATSDPRWGVAAPDSRGLRLVQAQGTERLDFRGIAARAWAIAPDAGLVEFRGAGDGAAPLRFDLSELTLGPAVGRRDDLSRPRPAVSTVPPAGLGLPRGTVLRATDSAGGLTLFGTDDYLVLTDQAGREIARHEIATAAWGVAIARTRPVAVAAHGDGTLRWYALDGDRPLTELGGLFVAADERRWLAWRADGRFAHSAGGGARLVGFLQNGRFLPGHVAEGELTGRWLDIDQLYRRLYDPNEVKAMLTRAGRALVPAMPSIQAGRLPAVAIQSLCPAEDRSAASRGIRVATALAGDNPADDAAPPANVNLPAIGGPGPASPDLCRRIEATALRRDETVALPEGTTAMRVTLSLDAAGTAQVSAFVNEQNVGRAVVRPDSTRGTGPATIEQLVPLFPGENLVEFRASLAGQQDFARAPTRLRVTIPAAPRAAPTPEAPARPVLRALVVGIDKYRGTIHELKFARADAQSFATAIKERTAHEYDRPMVTPLFDQDATADAVASALATLASEARPADAVVIYLAGHGVVGKQDKSYAFLTADVDDANAALDGGKGLGAERLARSLSEIRAERLFVFLDTCYAGAFDPRTIGYLNHDTGRYVLAASTRLEEALDGFDGRNGLFAYSVKEGLGRPAGAAARSIDAFDVGRYVTTRVEQLAQQRSWQQRAVFQAAGQITAFPLVSSTG